MGRSGATAAGIPQQLRLVISWNVAGFRRTHELIKSHYGSLDKWLLRHEADIFCIQETRVGRRDLLRASLAECEQLGAVCESYESFWAFNECSDNGSNMNGVAIWVRKDLAKGASATAKVLEDDFDREGRCLMLDLGSVVIFNVYAPFVNLKPDESAIARKLKFLQLLRKRVESMQAKGKMVILCGDLNLTWRNEDVHENSLCLKLSDKCIAGNPDWLVEPKTLEALRAAARHNTWSAEVSANWLRVGEAVKCLKSDLVLSFEEAQEALKTASESAIPSPRPGLRLLRLALLPCDNQVSQSAEEALLWSLSMSEAPSEALNRTDSSLRGQQVLLQFGLTPGELATYGHTPHWVNEPQCVEHMMQWLGDNLLDTFAECHQRAQGRFTCWMQNANLRYNNKGSRLDYILCDKKLRTFLVKSEALTGATRESDAHSSQAAWNAATNFGRWHGSHPVQKSDGGGLSLQQDDMKLNDTQFRTPHTGILYTPPKYSDHVPVCAYFEALKLPLGMSGAPKCSETRQTQPWTAQTTLTSLFSSKRQKVSA
eukprot:Skav225460  [mRNA]  locus=scaffold881:124686:126311:+ [translate_table: standard]